MHSARFTGLASQAVDGRGWGRWLTGAVTALGLAVAATGCGGGSDEAPATPGVATIGAAGGTLSSAEGVRISVPAGSLSESITLRIARDTTGLNTALAGGTPAPERAVALSPIYAMTPHGTTFAQPLELRIPIDQAAAAGPGMLVALRTDPGSPGWDVLPIKAVENGEAVVSTTSFSYYQIVKINNFLTPGAPPLPPKLEMSMTLGGATPTDFRFPSGASSNITYRRLYGVIATPADSLRLSGRVVGLPAACSQIALAGQAVPTQDSTAADVTVGAFNANEVFAVVTAEQGVDTTGGAHRPTLSFGLDFNLANAPFKAQLFERLRANSVSGPTPPVGLVFNAWARCTTPVDMGGGIVLQNFLISPGQWLEDPYRADFSYFDNQNWTFNTIRFTDYLPQGYITHPQAVTAATGSATSFSTSAWPVPVGEQRIEWWRSDNDGTTWTRVRATIVPVSATADTYTLDSVAARDNNALFRARLCTVPRIANLDEKCVDGIAARLTVLQGMSAPTFSEQPRAMLVRTAQTASFTAAAFGLPTPTLQWQTRPANSSGAWTNVAAGAGANTSNYTTPALSTADNGTQYRVVASNALGSAESAAAAVSVSDQDVAPTITTQPASLSVTVGNDAAFAIAARGTEALSYEWRKDGVAINGANSPVLRLPAVNAGQAGAYSVTVSNAAGTVASTAAALTVSAGTPADLAPTIVTQPVSVLVSAGNTATFAVGASGSGTLSYQWLRNGQPIAGAKAAFHSIASAAVDDAASYAVQVSNGVGPGVKSADAVLTVNAGPQLAALVLTTQPSPQVQAPGAGATFAVAATGSAPITYQWLKNGAPVAGATAAVLTLSNLTGGDAGAYSVAVTNPLGSVTSNAASLSILGAPVIGTQPLAATAREGTTASFGATASGSSLRYQWTRNSIAITGAVSASYTTPALTLADSGAVYGVVVYNGAGVAISQGAVLTVTPAPTPPATTLQPVNVTVDAGLPANFCMAFSGTPPFTLEMLRWVNGAWARVGSAVTVNDNGPVCLSTPQLQLADNGAQFLFIAGNGAVSEALTNVVTVTVVPVVTPGMALYAGDFSLGGGGGARDGTGTAAYFDVPEGLAADSAGNLYVAQSNGLRMAKIAPGGVVTTLVAYSAITATNQLSQLALAPDGSLYTAGASWCGLFRTAPPLAVGATTAELSVTGCGIETRGIAVDANGVVYLSLTTDHTIVRIATPDAGGNTSASVFAGGGNRFVAPGSIDGTGSGARFTAPRGIAFGPGGDLFVADSGNHTIRRITPAGVASTFAGTAGSAGTVDASGRAARFNTPTDLAFEADGNLLVLERGSFANGFASYVRRITPAGAVSTLFNVGDEAAALATPGQEAFARSPKGLAVLGPRRIALTVGNAVLIRTLP
jgi:sugar lactone lactonase YvrE